MKKILISVAVCAFLVGMSGCFRHTYTMGDGGTHVRYNKWNHHFLAGLIDGNEPIHLDQICPKTNNVTVYERQSFLNSIVGGITSGIYTPTSITVSCGSAKD